MELPSVSICYLLFRGQIFDQLFSQRLSAYGNNATPAVGQGHVQKRSEMERKQRRVMEICPRGRKIKEWYCSSVATSLYVFNEFA